MSQNSMLEPEIQKRVQEWLHPPFDEKTRQEVQELIQQGPEAIRDAFYTSLSFGTGGMRGLMGAGTTRMNQYTVRMATEGLAKYILKQKITNPSVFIGFDSRHHSPFFARQAAEVLALHGIKVYLLKNLRPTPFISFGCRQKKCTAAIMITASHNPAVYNGYKVYWSDGGQVVAPHDTGILQEVQAIGSFQKIKLSSPDDRHIEILDEELDEPYLKAIHPLQLFPEENKRYGKGLKIVYTSLHGTGITLCPLALMDWGFSSIQYVEEQIIPDGDFPTVKFPNPEYKETLSLGIETLLQTEADLLIANDPDADRTGIAVMHHGKACILTGNEVASLCVDHIARTLQERKKLPEMGAFVTTIVSSDLIGTIAKSYGAHCFEVLTGFKYIGELIHLWESSNDGYQFLFGAEESYGFLLGTHSRDKDAIVSSCLISEIALQAKRDGKTLLDRLYGLYQKHGIFREQQLAIDFKPGKEGMDEMASYMSRQRKNPLKAILGKKAVSIEDYKTRIRCDLISGKQEALTLPKSDVLLYRFEDGSKIVVRPSGTEPKIKIYAGVRHHHKQIELGIQECDKKLDELLASMKKELTS